MTRNLSLGLLIFGVLASGAAAEVPTVTGSPIKNAPNPYVKADWTSVKKSSQAELWKDAGAGNAEKPTRYYLTWTDTTKAGANPTGGPLLVFVDPAEAEHSLPPSVDTLFLTNTPIVWPDVAATPAQPLPYQIWKFPTHPTQERGLYAGVWGISQDKTDVAGVKPILWWGLAENLDAKKLVKPDSPKPLEAVNALFKTETTATPAPTAPGACPPQTMPQDDVVKMVAKFKPFSADTRYMSNMGFLSYCLHERKMADPATQQDRQKDPMLFEKKNWVSINEARKMLVGAGFDAKQITTMEKAYNKLPASQGGTGNREGGAKPAPPAKKPGLRTTEPPPPAQPAQKHPPREPGGGKQRHPGGGGNRQLNANQQPPGSGGHQPNAQAKALADYQAAQKKADAEKKVAQLSSVEANALLAKAAALKKSGQQKEAGAVLAQWRAADKKAQALWAQAKKSQAAANQAMESYRIAR